MITTSTYVRETELKRDLLAAFSAIDHATSAALPPEEVDRAVLRLLLRIAALCSLHGPAVPRHLLEALPRLGSLDAFAAVSQALDTGTLPPPGQGAASRELQQELVHFSRIVDVGAAGFDRPCGPGSKRVRNSHRLPESLKVLTELMVVARGRILQRGGTLPRPARRRPGSQRSEPDGTLLVQLPAHAPDHLLIVASPRRRLRLQAGYYLETLLAYLLPGEAFAALAAWWSEVAPPPGLHMSLAEVRSDRLLVHEWAYQAGVVAGRDPFTAALALLPRVTEIPLRQPAGTVHACAGPADADLSLTWDGRKVTLARGHAGIGRALAAATLLPAGSRQVRPERLVAAAVAVAGRALAGCAVRSIECGHVHLDRDLDIDQETGVRIGAAVYALMSARQPTPPLLTPMMDDEHVLVRLRPSRYAAFLAGHLGTRAFHLIPESSPIVRGIAVALAARLATGGQRQRLATRGRNLFFQLRDGTFCELFEDFEGEPVPGCVLFEAALLVYRTDPPAFDGYVQDRFGTAEHVHTTAARILDGDQPHDVRVAEVAELYRRFAAVTDPKHPDAGFGALVERVLEQATAPVTHLNVLEDYYEVQQGKVRQLLAAAGVPLRLVTLHFNTQTGRVALEG